MAAPAGDDEQARLDRVALLFELRAWTDLDGAIPHDFDALVRESFGPQLAARDVADAAPAPAKRIPATVS